MGFDIHIELPVNGRMGRARVDVVGDDKKTVFTDMANLAELKERRRVARLMATRLGEEQEETEAWLEKTWNDKVTEQRNDQAACQDVPPPPPEPADPLRDTPPDVRARAEATLEDPGLLRCILDDIEALGVAGEKKIALVVYVAGVSRLLAHPLAVRIHGPSASGKSFLVEKVARLFPLEAVIHATQMTPQALFHMKPGSLAHRFVVAGERSRIQEDEQAEATRALREMISAGRLTKLMPVKQPGGLIETVTIEQEGPIAYVETTTLARVFDEDENRSIALHTDEREDQTRLILERTAEGYITRDTAAVEGIIQRHHAIQRLLESLPVSIDYADRVAEKFTAVRVEARRAFPHLMNMVQAVTLLHQRQRELDRSGQLIATREDYAIAREYLDLPLLRLLGGMISEPAFRFFTRLQKWAGQGQFTTVKARQNEKASRSAVSAWLGELSEAGFIDLIEAGRGRQPAKWKVAGNPPDDAARVGIPAVSEVFG